MLNLTLLMAFIPTFLFVSYTPGMCMTLSMSLSISYGIRKTLWMMWGELIGVGLVAIFAVLGVATLMLSAPLLFTVFKWAGGFYLAWLGWQMWASKGRLALTDDSQRQTSTISRWRLFSQGFITAVANPKGWAFFMVLLPPFIDDQLPLVTQLAVLIVLILLIEWTALLSYALGGKAVQKLLRNAANVRVINRLSGTLLIGVGIWLALG